jgi:hypothetical protein
VFDVDDGVAVAVGPFVAEEDDDDDDDCNPLGFLLLLFMVDAELLDDVLDRGEHEPDEPEDDGNDEVDVCV